MEMEFLYWLQSLHTPFLDWFMAFITTFGNGGIFWIAVGVVLLCMKKYRKYGLALLLSLLFGLLIGNLGLKPLVMRSRPCWNDPTVPLLISVPKDFSFPSGHSLCSFEGATSLFLMNRRLGAAAYILAALVAFSRLYLFVHFPTDVLAGTLLGILFGVLANKLVMRFWREKNCSC